MVRVASYGYSSSMYKDGVTEVLRQESLFVGHGSKSCSPKKIMNVSLY